MTPMMSMFESFYSDSDRCDFLFYYSGNFQDVNLGLEVRRPCCPDLGIHAFSDQITITSLLSSASLQSPQQAGFVLNKQKKRPHLLDIYTKIFADEII